MQGSDVTVKFKALGELQENGKREVFFETLCAFRAAGSLRKAGEMLGVSHVMVLKRLRAIGVSSRRTSLDDLERLDGHGWAELRAAILDGLPYEDAIELALEWVGEPS